MQSINYPSNYRYLMEATAGELNGASPSQRCMCKARRAAQAQSQEESGESEKQQMCNALAPSSTGTADAKISGDIPGSTQLQSCPCHMWHAQDQQQQQQQLVPVQSPGQQRKPKCSCGHSSSSMELPTRSSEDPQQQQQLVPMQCNLPGPQQSRKLGCSCGHSPSGAQLSAAKCCGGQQQQQLVPVQSTAASQAYFSAADTSSTTQNPGYSCPVWHGQDQPQQQQQQQQLVPMQCSLPGQQQSRKPKCCSDDSPQQHQLVPVQPPGPPLSKKLKCLCSNSQSKSQLLPKSACCSDQQQQLVTMQSANNSRPYFSAADTSSTTQHPGYSCPIIRRPPDQQQQQQLMPCQRQPRKHKYQGAHSTSNAGSDDEFYSLSSASSERDENTLVSRSAGRGCTMKMCPHSTKQPQSSLTQSSQPAQVQLQFEAHVMQGPATGTATTADSTSVSQARNTAILQLLQEVVHLIKDEAPCNITPAKMRNIGHYGKEDSSADNGPFSSSLKIAYTPSRKGSSPTGSRMPSEHSEGLCPCQSWHPVPSQQALASQQALVSPQALVSQQAMAMQQAFSQMQSITQPMTIPLQFPCNLIITPVQYPVDAPLPRSSQPCPAACVEMSCPEMDLPPTTVQFRPTFDDAPKSSGQDEVVKDLELIEEIAALAMEPPQGESNFPEDSGNCCDEMCSEPNSGQGPSKRCPMDGCVCPVHGVFIASDSQGREDSSLAQNTADYDDDDVLRTRSEGSEKPGQPGGAECDGMDAEDCTCCHCRAMRHKKKHNCLTIATPMQAMEKSSCSELRFFIDSIIMDLDAMDHARRKKQADQDCAPKPKICCPRKSYPVTITDVTDLGTSSLYVKWCIHDCFGIGGYEIYVDGYLTNRYFHCNHEAAVVCDIDVTQPHKIVLLAQPKVDDHYNDIGCGSSPGDRCKQLLRKSDAEKMKKPECAQPALWTPSIYLYDPTNKDDVLPLRRGTM